MCAASASAAGAAPSSRTTEPTCMWAPASSKCRKEASSGLSRSGPAMRGAESSRSTPRLQTFNTVYNVAYTPQEEPAMNLQDPTAFARAYDEHSRTVYSTAYRVLHDATLAQDVVQDVFLRVWRRPEGFDPARGS